jgi:hypothetical protein
MPTFRVGDLSQDAAKQTSSSSRLLRTFSPTHSRSLPITIATMIFTVFGTTMVLKRMMTYKYEEDEEKTVINQSKKELSSLLLANKSQSIDEERELQQMESKLGWDKEFNNVNVPRPKS